MTEPRIGDMVVNLFIPWSGRIIFISKDYINAYKSYAVIGLPSGINETVYFNNLKAVYSENFHYEVLRATKSH